MSIDWAQPPFSTSSLRGYFHGPWSFEETVARIAAASGQPVQSDDDYKTSVSFEGTFNGQRFTLYDYKEDREIHVGGSAWLDVDGLCDALKTALANVTPQPYAAPEFYDEKQGHSFP